jgi:hypothetical protein
MGITLLKSVEIGTSTTSGKILRGASRQSGTISHNTPRKALD